MTSVPFGTGNPALFLTRAVTVSELPQLSGFCERRTVICAGKPAGVVGVGLGVAVGAGVWVDVAVGLGVFVAVGVGV